MQRETVLVGLLCVLVVTPAFGQSSLFSSGFPFSSDPTEAESDTPGNGFFGRQTSFMGQRLPFGAAGNLGNLFPSGLPNGDSAQTVVVNTVTNGEKIQTSRLASTASGVTITTSSSDGGPATTYISVDGNTPQKIVSNSPNGGTTTNYFSSE